MSISMVAAQAAYTEMGPCAVEIDVCLMIAIRNSIINFNIFEIATSHILKPFPEVFCEVCPYFLKLSPEKKVDCKDIQNECKKGNIKEFCAQLEYYSESTKKSYREKMKNLTWKEACKKFC
ncbi:unnamed protein product [Cylicocyclus nassatus]|uniref:Uncharacterized protein n=1 Tax=Cylicocyclus nassatus TaxID=53992 RepID=A0AA36HCA2_CYLNA|nr:unnamed protein product [Cylicocyclus nassatus]